MDRPVGRGDGARHAFKGRRTLTLSGRALPTTRDRSRACCSRLTHHASKMRHGRETLGPQLPAGFPWEAGRRARGQDPFEEGRDVGSARAGPCKLTAKADASNCRDGGGGARFQTGQIPSPKRSGRLLAPLTRPAHPAAEACRTDRSRRKPDLRPLVGRKSGGGGSRQRDEPWPCPEGAGGKEETHRRSRESTPYPSWSQRNSWARRGNYDSSPGSGRHVAGGEDGGDANERRIQPTRNSHRRHPRRRYRNRQPGSQTSTLVTGWPDVLEDSSPRDPWSHLHKRRLREQAAAFDRLGFWAVIDADWRSRSD